MFRLIRDDPDVKVQVWEHKQANKAGITVEAWRERERQAREAEEASSQKTSGTGTSVDIDKKP